MNVVSRLDSSGNFSIKNTGVFDEVTTTVDYTNQYSAYFDSSNNDYLSISSAPVPATGQFTIEAWIYTTASASQTIYSQYLQSGDANRWHFSIDNNTGYKLSFAHGTAATAWGSTVVPLNQWNHVAVTRDASNNLKFFLNGILDGTTSSYTATLSQNAPRISGFLNTGISTYNFQGYISNLRILSGTSLYSSNFIPSTVPLTAILNTTLLTCQNSTIVDNSGTSKTITNPGSIVPSLLPQSDFYAASFSNQFITIPAAAGVASYGSDFTIEFWFNTSTLTGAPFGLAAQYRLTTGRSWIINYDTNSSINAFGMNSGANSVPINVWHHIAVVKNGANFYLYLNGKQVGTTSSSTPAASTENIYLGGNHDMIDGSVVWRYEGKISNFRIVKGTPVYTGEFTPSIDLTAIAGTSVLTLQDPTIIDKTGNYSITNPTSVTTSLIDSLNTFPDPVGSFTSRQYSDGNHLVFGEYDEVTLLTDYTPYTAGKDYSAVYTTTGQYLTVPASSAFNFGAGDFTIEMWAYKNTSADNKLLITNRPSVGATFAGCWWLDTNGNRIRFALYDSTGTIYQFFASTADFPDYEWFHIACVRSGSDIIVYLNGTAVSSNPVTGSFGSSGAIYIGSFPNDTATWYWLGNITNVRIVKGSAVYTANFTPSTVPFSAADIPGTSLLTLQDSTIVDNSTNGFTITNTGTVTTYKPPYSSFYSVSFNGSSRLKVPSNSALALGTGDFTIEAWINPTSITGNMIVIDFRTLTLDTAIWILVSTTDIRMNVGGNTQISGPLLTVNQWYHVALSRIAGSTKMFLNGTQIGSTYVDNNNYIVGTNGPTIGAYDTSASGYFDGYMSNIRVIKGAGLYTGNFTPSTQQLTAVSGTVLLTFQSATIVDNSPNAFTLTTTTGAVRILPSTPFTLQTPVVRREYPNGNYLIKGIFDEITPIGEEVYSVAFDGASQYLSIADNEAFEFGSGDFTLETWIYLTNYSAEYGSGPSYYYAAAIIVKDSNPNDNRRAFSFQLNGTASSWTTLGINLFTNDTTYNYTSGTYNFNLNTWYHVAAVRSSGTVTLYVDGVSVGSASNPTTIQASAGPVTIGYTNYAAASDVSYWFPGYMSNLRIVKGSAVYTGNFTPQEFALTAVSGTSLLTCQSATLIDNSPNSFTITNNSTVIYKQPYPLFYIARFSSQYLYLPSSTTLDLATSNFTIEAWFKTGSTAAYQTILGNPSSPNVSPQYGTNHWAIQIGAAGTKLVMTYQPFGIGFLTSTTTVSDGLWHHFAITRSGDTFKMYVDGVLESTYTSSAGASMDAGSTRVTTIGTFDSGAYFNGFISNLRIVKGSVVYSANFTPPITPLVAISGTTLLTLKNSTLIDNSTANAGNPFTITNVGVSIGPDQPF